MATMMCLSKTLTASIRQNKWLRRIPIWTFILFQAFASTVDAEEFQCGIYENLLLAVDRNGNITGRYSESQGEGVQKTCNFYFTGKAKGGAAEIITWSDRRLPGGLKALKDGVELTVPRGREHTGCGLVLLPQISDGIVLDLLQRKDFQELKGVVADIQAKEKAPSVLPLLQVDKGAGGFPDRLVGTWDVVGVKLDTTFGGRTYYQYDDKRLRGKTITIRRTEAKGNLPEQLQCIGPMVAEQTGKLDNLLRATMAGQDELEEASVARKFDLATEGQTTVTAFWVGCKNGDFGPDGPLGPRGRNWILLLPSGALATRWYDNTILVMKRKGK